MPHKILIVDDEADIRAAVQGILEDEGYSVQSVGTADEAVDALAAAAPDLVILDVWLKKGDRDGLDLLAKIRKRHRHMPVLMMSGHGTIEMAVTAMKHGAYDFIEKPFQTDRMLMTITRAIEASTLRMENLALREKVEGTADLVGTSPQILTIRAAIEKVAPTNSRVLLTGLPGTGKEVAARMIHRLSPRAGSPFVVVNCAMLEPDRLETELFGSPHHPGTLKQADGGTLFLDEVNNMPLATQAKILRVLQDQKYQHPVTGAWIDVDIRVISSTSDDIERQIREGLFREDLYYRLNVVTLNMPAIHERRDDIPVFIRHFMAECAQDSGRPVRDLTPNALTTLQMYAWPGNVRQLKNVAEWLVIMASGASDTAIDVDDLPPELHQTKSDHEIPVMPPEMIALPLRDAREVFERAYLQAQITRFGGSVSKAAQFVGMERSALHRKLKMLNVGPDNNDESDQTDPEREVA